MFNKFIFFASICLFWSFNCLSQKPAKPNSSEIFSQIQKLNFLGTVLYVAAHPDDENTRLISFLSNDTKARTCYLSLTRGDGGQNLIGTELRELLGAIRTQELIEARKIDGGEQFFSRANDFGYSKNPTETLQIWDKNQVLSDIVWQIRKLQPDVIINRFDHRSPGTTHGHHTASGMLSVESFGITGDKNQFSDQLKLVNVWQPKRVFFNTSWWFYGSQEKFDKADKTNLLGLNIGSYYSLLGKSNQEIAALSRSCHQSQGFGSTGARGQETEYLELIKGDLPKDKTNIFDGVDTSWKRVKGGEPIEVILKNVEKNFNFKNPSASVLELVKAYNLIEKLEDKHWREYKSEEIKKIILACSGLFLEAVADNSEVTAGKTLKLKIETINRSDANVVLKSISVLPIQKVITDNVVLKNNIKKITETSISLSQMQDYTDPYWLKNAGTIGMYRVDSQELIGIPDVIRQLKVSFLLNIENTDIRFEKDIIFKKNDEVKGEVYKPLDIVPDVAVSFIDKVVFFNSKSKLIAVRIKSNTENVSGQIELNLDSNWKVTPNNFLFTMTKIGEEQTVIFDVTAPKSKISIDAKAKVIVAEKTFDKEQIIIEYPHIANQQILQTATAKFIKLDIKIGNEKIGYIMGAGDEVPKYLSLMGYEVKIIKPENISEQSLKEFDVIITGIRAYNTIEELAFKQKILLDFVKNGKTMVVQYNTMGKFVTKELAPFPIKISHDRVTEENAEVRFLAPKHSVLNYPNTITTNDFVGWVQEQGLYYPETWDASFTTIISANDQNETPKNSSILVANHGKGVYIYTGLSFFRELPAGVVGAYRLLANIIATKQQ